MNPQRSALVLAVTVLLLLPAWSPALAAPPPGQEMLLFQDIPSVFSASKYEQKVTEAPSSVSIVTAEEIRKYGYRTLADILRSLRSFHLSYDRIYHQVGVRGFNRPGDTNSRFLLLVDGLRTNDGLFDGSSVDTAFPLDIDLIDRVEVVRGPSSSLYGTNAFFGVINVITRRGRDLQGPELAAAAGSHRTYRGRASYGSRLDSGLEVLLSGTWYESEGDDDLYFEEFDTPETGDGVARDNDDDKAGSLFASCTLGDFLLEAMYVDKEKRFPTAPYGTEFDDSRTRGEAENVVAQLRYRRHLDNQWNVTARLGYNYYASNGDYVYDYSPDETPFLVINKDEFRSEWWNAEVHLDRHFKNRHHLIFGGEYQDRYRLDQKNYDLAVYLDEQRDSQNWGVFLQDEYEISDELTLILGLRRDDYDTFGATTNPRLAAIYRPRRQTVLKLLYGEAFRAPNAFELYYHDGFEFQKPNPDLDPETITTYELIWEEYPRPNLRTVATAFYYEIDDLINFSLDPNDGLLFFDNLDEVEATGLELEVEGSLGEVKGRLSYTYQQVEDGRTGRRISNSPRHLAKLNLIVPLWRDRLLLGIEEQITGERKTLSGDETGGYAVTNLTLFGQHLAPGLEIAASAYNLFDKKYSDPASGAHRQETLEQEGRLFRLEITYLF